MKKLLLLGVIALGVATVACDKDEDPAETSKTDLLTNGSSKSWITTSFFVNDVDITAFQDTCDQDDLIVFKSDKTMHGDEGSIKCDPSDPQTYDHGTWYFANNETQIISTTPDIELDTIYIDTANVLELTNTSLKITGKEEGDVFEVHLQAQ